MNSNLFTQHVKKVFILCVVFDLHETIDDKAI